MSRLVLALGALALLSGCAGLALPVAGGGLAGAAATVVAVNSDADTTLKVAKPFNEVLCLLHPYNPVSEEAKAAIAAFCANLPDSTGGFLFQQWKIIQAVEAAHAKGAKP